jgi:hypothetical protein
VSLIEFIIKFYTNNKLKIKFVAFDNDIGKTVIKTLTIENHTYIPDELRHLEVDNITADDGYIVIKVHGILNNESLSNIKRKQYIFEDDIILE